MTSAKQAATPALANFTGRETSFADTFVDGLAGMTGFAASGCTKGAACKVWLKDIILGVPTRVTFSILSFVQVLRKCEELNKDCEFTVTSKGDEKCISSTRCCNSVHRPRRPP